MSDTFDLVLVPHKFKLTFPRSAFCSLFPDSIVAVALADLDATEIFISQEVVTPLIAHYLLSITKGARPPFSLIDFTQAGQYLHIPLLEMVSDPRYADLDEKYPTGKKLNLLHPEDCVNPVHYAYLMGTIVWMDWHLVFDYIWSHLDPAQYPETNRDLSLIAVYKGSIKNYCKLREHCGDFPLEEKANTVQRLLLRPERKDLANLSFNIIHIAGLGCAMDMLRFLVLHPPTKLTKERITESWGQAMVIATIANKVDQVELMKPLASSEFLSIAIQQAHEHKNLPMIGHLVVDNVKGDDPAQSHTPERILYALIRRQCWGPVAFIIREGKLTKSQVRTIFTETQDFWAHDFMMVAPIVVNLFEQSFGEPLGIV